MLQEPETGDWPGQRGEGAVQAGDQTGRPPQGPGAEAGQTEQGDRGARGPGKEEADAGDPGQANMRCTDADTHSSFQDVKVEEIAMLYS